MFTGCVFLSIIYVLSKYITFNDQGFILLYTISRASYTLWSITLPVNLRGNGAFFLAKAAAEVLTGDSPAVALPPSQAVALALELVVDLTVRAQITVEESHWNAHRLRLTYTFSPVRLFLYQKMFEVSFKLSLCDRLCRELVSSPISFCCNTSTLCHTLIILTSASSSLLSMTMNWASAVTISLSCSAPTFAECAAHAIYPELLWPVMHCWRPFVVCQMLPRRVHIHTASQSVFWLGMINDIKTTVQHCTLCAQHQHAQPKMQNQQPDLPTRPCLKLGPGIFSQSSS